MLGKPPTHPHNRCADIVNCGQASFPLRSSCEQQHGRQAFQGEKKKCDACCYEHKEPQILLRSAPQKELCESHAQRDEERGFWKSDAKQTCCANHTSSEGCNDFSARSSRQRKRRQSDEVPTDSSEDGGAPAHSCRRNKFSYGKCAQQQIPADTRLVTRAKSTSSNQGRSHGNSHGIKNTGTCAKERHLRVDPRETNYRGKEFDERRSKNQCAEPFEKCTNPECTNTSQDGRLRTAGSYNTDRDWGEYHGKKLCIACYTYLRMYGTVRRPRTYISKGSAKSNPKARVAEKVVRRPAASRSQRAHEEGTHQDVRDSNDEGKTRDFVAMHDKDSPGRFGRKEALKEQDDELRFTPCVDKRMNTMQRQGVLNALERCDNEHDGEVSEDSLLMYREHSDVVDDPDARDYGSKILSRAPDDKNTCREAFFVESQNIR
jgi:hypothetical protein